MYIYVYRMKAMPLFTAINRAKHRIVEQVAVALLTRA